MAAAAEKHKARGKKDIGQDLGVGESLIAGDDPQQEEGSDGETIYAPDKIADVLERRDGDVVLFGLQQHTDAKQDRQQESAQQQKPSQLPFEQNIGFGQGV